MQQILVYGDSLSWGIVPGTRERFPFEQRWPGVLEHALNQSGRRIRVIEECLNGRRTAFDDPFKPGRNGLVGIAQKIESHSPLALVIVMLGTNDFQSMHPHTAWHAAAGIDAIVSAIRSAPIEPGMPVPRILLVAPPLMDVPRAEMADKFAGAPAKATGLAAAIERIAADRSCRFFDAGTVIGSSHVDGVHLDGDQHVALGQAIAQHLRHLDRTTL